MRFIPLLCSVLFIITTSITHGQNIYPEKVAGCPVKAFCLDCGDPKTVFAEDLTAYFNTRIPAETHKKIKGQVLLQVLVDSVGHPCVISVGNKTNSRNLAALRLVELVNAMPAWNPALEKGKPIRVSTSLRFDFADQRLAVGYQRFDMAKVRNMASVGEVNIANKTQTYPKPPANARLQVYNTRNSAIPWDMMRAVCPDTDNTVWVGTDNGLVKINNGQMTVLNASNSALRLKHDNTTINSIAVDARNQKWLTDGYTTYRFDGTTWSVFDSTNSPLKYNSTIYADKAGSVWCYGSNGICRFDGKTWTQLTTKNSPLPFNNISSVFVDSRQRAWVGTYKGNIQFDGSKTQTYTTPDTPLGLASITSTEEDAAGNLWFGLYDSGHKHEGLARYGTDGQWTTYTVANSGIPGNNVLDVAWDKKTNTLWTSINNVGLARFDGTTWTIFTPANSAVPSTYIQDISFDADGNLWAATFAGLLKLQIK